MPPAARITDLHTCPVSSGPVPHVGGPLIEGASTVLIGFLPAARVGDKCLCAGPVDVVAKGSATVNICHMKAARLGDNTVHGGLIVYGLPTVLIGDAGSGNAPVAIGAFKDAAAQGKALVCKGPCPACGQL